MLCKKTFYKICETASKILLNQSLPKSSDIIRHCLNRKQEGKKEGGKKKLLIYNRISVSAKWQLYLITHGSLQLEIQIPTLQDANFHGTSHGESLLWQLRFTRQDTVFYMTVTLCCPWTAIAVYSTVIAEDACRKGRTKFGSYIFYWHPRIEVFNFQVFQLAPHEELKASKGRKVKPQRQSNSTVHSIS